MLSPKRCLFIDDDADDQDFFCEAAKTIDPEIECLFAANGVEAVSQLNENDYIPDFIFVDMHMPMMDGRETLQQIRKMERLNQASVYIYSTAEAPGIANEMIHLGATDFLVKPNNMEGLHELLRKILK